MTAQELIERLTALVKLQADIIQEQAAALAQLEAVTTADEKRLIAERERKKITGDDD